LIIHEKEVISWGDEVTDIVMAIRFDPKEYLVGDQEKSGNVFSPFEFLSAWIEKNGV